MISIRNLLESQEKKQGIRELCHPESFSDFSRYWYSLNKGLEISFQTVAAAPQQCWGIEQAGLNKYGPPLHHITYYLLFQVVYLSSWDGNGGRREIPSPFSLIAL